MTLSPRGVGTLGRDAIAGKGAGKARITALQYLLLEHQKIGVDGLWGPETSGAVRNVQKKFDLNVDGIPGPATLGALAEQIKRGDNGNIVKAAQAALNGKGASLEVDGAFGSGTHSAVEKFQKDNNLGVDGIVGKWTWTELFKGGSGNPDSDRKLLSEESRKDWLRYTFYAA